MQWYWRDFDPLFCLKENIKKKVQTVCFFCSLTVETYDGPCN